MGSAPARILGLSVFVRTRRSGAWARTEISPFAIDESKLAKYA